jgi:hypothetical protein
MDHSNNAERNTRGGSDGLFAVNRVRAEAAAQRANEGTELVILSGLKKKVGNSIYVDVQWAQKCWSQCQGQMLDEDQGG